MSPDNPDLVPAENAVDDYGRLATNWCSVGV